MRSKFWMLALIVVIAATAATIIASPRITITNPANDQTIFDRVVEPRLGLDLRGGVQVLLEADLPADAEITAESMNVARDIIENRTNAMGVSENVIQIAGDRRIVGEFPGVKDASEVLATIQSTGLLEFIDAGTTYLNPETIVQTDYSPTGTPTTPADGITVYHTVMTGLELKAVSVDRDDLGRYVVNFELTDEGADIFATHTASSIGRYLAIVLDKKVISSPIIESAIVGGTGQITGQFTYDEVNNLAIQLRYGSLPIPLKIVETRIIGPTLGEDSLTKSLYAGIIGFAAVIIFMILFYRLPGFVAIIAIFFYGAVAFAWFEFMPVTLTLAGIAGFLLSTGAALDANILYFERIKEELRSGRTLEQAITQGWKRAISSIFDSNLATIFTSLVLLWFGSTFGATIVKGFSITLMGGVVISLFTVWGVTRTLLALITNYAKPKNLEFWFGL